MYEYKVVKATNEARLEAKLNELAAQGWEAVGYGIRPAGGIWFFLFSFYADHFVLLRRVKD